MAATISTDRKIQLHRHPRGPAWLLGFGSSPTQDAAGLLSMYSNSQGEGNQLAQLRASRQELQGGCSPSCRVRTLGTVLVEFSSLLSLLCSGTVRHSGSARMNRAYGHNGAKNTEAEENSHGNQTDAKCLPSAGYSRACR